jgi:Protein of unknown function (DUF3761)
MKRFVEGIDRGQSTLFPECLEDWICEDNAMAQVSRPINGECPPETYKNVDGNCVERPTIPNDRGAATARCRDGENSYPQHRTGTCSRHGGVKAWLRKDL